MIRARFRFKPAVLERKVLVRQVRGQVAHGLKGNIVRKRKRNWLPKVLHASVHREDGLHLGLELPSSALQRRVPRVRQPVRQQNTRSTAALVAATSA